MGQSYLVFIHHLQFSCKSRLWPGTCESTVCQFDQQTPAIRVIWPKIPTFVMSSSWFVLIMFLTALANLTHDSPILVLSRPHFDLVALTKTLGTLIISKRPPAGDPSCLKSTVSESCLFCLGQNFFYTNNRPWRSNKCFKFELKTGNFAGIVTCLFRQFLRDSFPNTVVPTSPLYDILHYLFRWWYFMLHFAGLEPTTHELWVRTLKPVYYGTTDVR